MSDDAATREAEEILDVIFNGVTALTRDEAKAAIMRIRHEHATPAQVEGERMTDAQFAHLDKPGTPVSELDLMLIMRELHNSRTSETTLLARLADLQEVKDRIYTSRDEEKEHYQKYIKGLESELARLRTQLADMKDEMGTCPHCCNSKVFDDEAARQGLAPKYADRAGPEGHPDELPENYSPREELK